MSKPGLDRRRLAAPEPTVQPILIKSSPQPILDAELTREDGRYPEQMRPAVIKRGIISRANGSAYVELGSTKLTCAVYGPRTSTGRVTMAKSYNPKGTLNCEIEFLPFSSFNRRPYQRDAEEAGLSAILEAALEPAIRMDLFPNAYLDVYLTVLEDDGSVLAAAILAASTALAQAQIEMYDSVVACSAAIINHAGGNANLVIIDPTRHEVSQSSGLQPNNTLMTVAIMPNRNRITQVHSVGTLSTTMYQEMLNMTLDGARSLYQSAVQPVLRQP